MKNSAKILAVGDIHGGIHSLFGIFEDWIKQKFLRDDYSLAPGIHAVFLGDYVDRGEGGVEVLFALLKLKIKNWDQVTLIRGNHEDWEINFCYGFVQELRKKYRHDTIIARFAEMLLKVYERMPSAVLIASGQSLASQQPTYALFLHGMLEEGLLHSVRTGISPAEPSCELSTTRAAAWGDIAQTLTDTEIEQYAKCDRPRKDQRWLETKAATYYSSAQIIVRGHQHALACGVLFEAKAWDELQKLQKSDISLQPYFKELFAGNYGAGGPFPIRAAEKLIEKVYGNAQPRNTFIGKVVTLSAAVDVPGVGGVNELGYLMLDVGSSATSPWSARWHSVFQEDDLWLRGTPVQNQYQRSSSPTAPTATPSSSSSSSSSSAAYTQETLTKDIGKKRQHDSPEEERTVRARTEGAKVPVAQEAVVARSSDAMHIETAIATPDEKQPVA